MMTNSQPNPEQSKAALTNPGHRHLQVLSGGQEWARQQAKEIIAQSGYDAKHILWLGEKTSRPDVTAIHADAASGILGGEFSLIVFDAFAGFAADAFGMVSGALCGGGTLILLCPPLDEWPVYDDPACAKLVPYGSKPLQQSRFLQHVAQVLQKDPHTRIFSSAFPESPAPSPQSRTRNDEKNRSIEFRNKNIISTNDQSCAIQAIIHTAKSRARRPIVLTADRGRGKTAALGMAAATLLQEENNVVITAPRPTACEQAFAHAARLLPQAEIRKNHLNLAGNTFSYVAPDALVHNETLRSNPPRLVMVDEAAAIPTPLLTKILQMFPRTVFATTVHGYEGTGRGFALRFRDTLNAQTPDWKAIALNEPIRWAVDDPLEKITNQLLLLDAETVDDTQIQDVTKNNCTTSRLDRDELLANKPLLSELFGLLVLAHYRTRPSDLRLLLDAPNVDIYFTRYNNHVVAVALVAHEGGLDADLARAISYGERRPQGHLLPETLAAQAGCTTAASLKAARIIRIAVHPVVQNKGLGAAMLAFVKDDLNNKVDYLGSVFGATPALLDFWRQAGFTPAWLGTRRGKSTGEHAVLVMQPFSNAGQEVTQEAKTLFANNLPQQLADPQCLNDLEPDLVCRLLQSSTAPLPPDSNDRHHLDTFAHGKRPYESILAPLWRLAHWVLADETRCALLHSAQITALVARVLQHQSWQATARACNVPGKDQVIALLREACVCIMENEDFSTTENTENTEE